MESTPGCVVVGVTGTGQTAALAYATEEARRTGAEVLLVHVHSLAMTPPPASILMVDDRWDDIAEGVVRRAHEDLEDLTGGSVPCRAVIRRGAPAQELADLSRSARMVVLQRRRHNLVERVFVGSTANGTAARAHCPVVSVPEGWTPEDPPGEVVVGVHDDGSPAEALSAAVAHAARSGSSLRVVHAWWVEPAYDDLVSEQDAQRWRTEQEARLAVVLEDIRARHPEVDVQVDVRRQRPADALLVRARDASLVVVGRHGSHTWLPGQLGSVARVVMREATSPVMVVPVGEHGTSTE